MQPKKLYENRAIKLRRITKKRAIGSLLNRFLTRLARLVAYCQLPATLAATGSQYRTPVPVSHTGQKPVLAAARNALWLPGSFHHSSLFTPSTISVNNLNLNLVHYTYFGPTSQTVSGRA